MKNYDSIILSIILSFSLVTNIQAGCVDYLFGSIVYASPALPVVLVCVAGGVGIYSGIKVWYWYNPTTKQLLAVSKKNIALLESKAYEKALQEAVKKGHQEVLKVIAQNKVLAMAKL